MTHRQTSLLRFIIEFQISHGRPPSAAEMCEGCNIESFAALRLDLTELVAGGVVKPSALDLPELKAVDEKELELARLGQRLDQLARDCELAEVHAQEFERAVAGFIPSESLIHARAYADGLRAALRLLTTRSS